MQEEVRPVSGGRPRDPVCGMPVEPTDAAGSIRRGGMTFYFCSVHCLRMFDEAQAESLRGPGP